MIGGKAMHVGEKDRFGMTVLDWVLGLMAIGFLFTGFDNAIYVSIGLVLLLLWVRYDEGRSKKDD